LFTYIKQQKGKFLFSTISRTLVFVLSFSLIFSPAAAQAQTILNLPVPGTMLAPSPAFVPVLLKGMTIHPDDPLKFDFIIDSGNTDFTTDEIKVESERLVKYFLASMTVPKDDLWVNLSPYEEDRIIPNELGKTELGRDMLAQDYVLKQLTASLMYPEKELGKKFWDKVYAKAEEQFGTREIPVNTFNKVWILPETATVYEHEQTVYIVDAHLKVMLDSDYQAMQSEKPKIQDSSLELQSSIIKEIIIPEIEREVNQGEHFAPLRQIYHSLILAKWYKETVKNSLLSQVYADKNLIAGVESDDPDIKDKVYAQYMEAYKKGVFNYIKEDYDRLSDEVIPRKYFSGGEKLTNIPLKVSSSPIIGKGFLGKGFKMLVALTVAAALSQAEPVFAQNKDTTQETSNEVRISDLDRLKMILNDNIVSRKEFEDVISRMKAKRSFLFAAKVRLFNKMDDRAYEDLFSQLDENQRILLTALKSTRFKPRSHTFFEPDMYRSLKNRNPEKDALNTFNREDVKKSIEELSQLSPEKLLEYISLIADLGYFGGMMSQASLNETKITSDLRLISLLKISPSAKLLEDSDDTPSSFIISKRISSLIFLCSCVDIFTGN